MAVLLRHLDLGHVALSLVQDGLADAPGDKHGLPRAVADICRVVHHAKLSLIKVTPRPSLSLRPPRFAALNAELTPTLHNAGPWWLS